MIIRYSGSGWLAPAIAFASAWCAGKLGAPVFVCGLVAALAVVVHGLIDTRAVFGLPLLILGIAGAVGWCLLWGIGYLAPANMGPLGWFIAIVGTGSALVAALGWMLHKRDGNQAQDPFTEDKQALDLRQQIRAAISEENAPRARVAGLLRSASAHPDFEALLQDAAKELRDGIQRKLQRLPLPGYHIDYEAVSETYLLLHEVAGEQHSLTRDYEQITKAMPMGYPPDAVAKLGEASVRRQPARSPLVTQPILRALAFACISQPQMHLSPELRAAVDRHVAEHLTDDPFTTAGSL